MVDFYMEISLLMCLEQRGKEVVSNSGEIWKRRNYGLNISRSFRGSKIAA
jgi:hypothetical protein